MHRKRPNHHPNVSLTWWLLTKTVLSRSKTLCSIVKITVISWTLHRRSRVTRLFLGQNSSRVRQLCCQRSLKRRLIHLTQSSGRAIAWTTFRIFSVMLAKWKKECQASKKTLIWKPMMKTSLSMKTTIVITALSRETRCPGTSSSSRWRTAGTLVRTPLQGTISRIQILFKSAKPIKVAKSQLIIQKLMSHLIDR